MKDQWIDWLQEKQRHFFYGITIVVTSLFIAFQVFGKFHKPKNRRYQIAYHAFDKWMLQGEAFEKLQKALKDNPELETKFGAQIADAFILQSEIDKAQPFADSVLNRVRKHTPEHTAFAEGSLLITKGEFQQALVNALSLKANLDQSSLLYGFNLVRIASLCCILENPDQEISILKELETYMETNKKASSILVQCFHENELTLADYIHHRKDVISKRNQ